MITYYESTHMGDVVAVLKVIRDASGSLSGVVYANRKTGGWVQDGPALALEASGMGGSVDWSPIDEGRALELFEAFAGQGR